MTQHLSPAFRKYMMVILILVLVSSAITCSAPQPPTSTPKPSHVIPTQTAHPPTATPTDTQRPTLSPTLPPLKTATPTLVDPFTLISQDSLFSYLEDLTVIQAYSGWRNSATQGETEALDYIAGRFDAFAYLQNLGVTLERQNFQVFNATELWETRLHLTTGGEEIEVPADGIRGHRDNNNLAVRFDSDGQPTDKERNPVIVEGPIALIESVIQIHKLNSNNVAGKILFLDYHAISRFGLDTMEQVVATCEEILALKPAGIVLVTRFSNEIGDSHGTFVGDSNGFTRIDIGKNTPVVPILYTRLEDLEPAGVTQWEDLTKIDAARLTWDADVIAPGTSSNLAAYIPGADRSQSVILSAHIDTPNSPGAMDDGSGSVVLLEVARVLDAARLQPAVDLILVWYGSEELGDYGSSHFVSTHQELLDHTLAMLQIDCLTRPLDGIHNAGLELVTWSYGRFGDERLTWPEYLANAAKQRGVQTAPVNRYTIESDNTPFSGFDVPNANLIYISSQMGNYGPIHYAGHIHSPYDTVELARDVGDVLEQMARVALTAGLHTAQETPHLRTVPVPDRRAVFIASHTEAEIMSPISFIEFGMALAQEGFDVDMIPFGQPVTAAELVDADLVVALPLIDYTTGEASPPNNASWSLEEIAALEAYVNQGGFLILTNSAHRIKFNNWLYDDNEDWIDVNDLAELFGVSYRFGGFQDKIFWMEAIDHPLVEKLSYMELMPDNAIPIRMDEGTVLAQIGNRVIIGLAKHGSGEVLALADLGILGNVGAGIPEHLNFWVNIARYVRSR